LSSSATSSGSGFRMAAAGVAPAADIEPNAKVAPGEGPGSSRPLR
jgi:hypothetical protein